MKKISKKEVYSSVLMLNFGMSTAVTAKQSRIEWYLSEYATQKDSLFGGGLGKTELLKRLKRLLPIEDEYFNQNLHLASNTNQRWVDFCDDCIILATLSAYLENKPIVLLHPDCFNPTKSSNHSFQKITMKPTLIEGIGINYLH